MTPTFSVIVPTYNVEKYLPEFLDSLARQTYPLDELDLIFVNDGSLDSSAEIIASWIDSTAPSATLLSKPNGGLSSARNTGLDRATGCWVTFPDPDDRLPPEYFARVAAFLDRDKTTVPHLVATHAVILDDSTGELIDEHPLRFRFSEGDRTVDLDRFPTYFHIQAASAFYRRDDIERLGLRFDHRVQPNFEDGHLTGQYLADHDHPLVAFLNTPLYHYRRRSDSSSLVQDSWHRPDKFTQVTRYGYLDLLERVAAKRGSVPAWLQNMVLYDLLWYFKHDERIHSTLGSLEEDIASEFHEVLQQIMRHIDVATIDDFRITRTSPEIRNALVIDTKGERVRPDHIRVQRVDQQRQIALVRYFYGGELPNEQFRGDGVPIEPIFSKSRSIVFLRRQMASERIVWLPANVSLSVTIDGKPMLIELGEQPRARYVLDPVDLWRRMSSLPQPPGWARPVASPPEHGSGNLIAVRRLGRAVEQELRARLRSTPVGRFKRAFQRLWVRSLSRDARFVRSARGIRGRRYRDAWLFIDRTHQAQDNAEHLYRYVRAARPDINAWFVLDRDTADWARLAAEDFRLVEHGSTQHTKLLLNCVHLISSQIDHHIMHPLDTQRFGRQRWRFTFLQHGVTKDDLSRWVNPKPISCFITATEAEHASLVADGTPYKYTEKEVRLTGFPRHDRLLELAADARLASAQPLLLVMPTWRRQLLGEERPDGRPREARAGFWESSYARNWMTLLTSSRFRSIADRAGLQVAFVPHPNMSVFVAEGNLPDHIQVYQYSDVNVQELFARGRLAVTDYSSNAFEMAYIHRPVVYFQFDRESFFSGQHAYRQGTWSYEHDGFGPVAESVEAVLDELDHLVAHGLEPQEPYLTRIEKGFAFRDGRACERVVEAIESMMRPLTREEAIRPIET